MRTRVHRATLDAKACSYMSIGHLFIYPLLAENMLCTVEEAAGVGSRKSLIIDGVLHKIDPSLTQFPEMAAMSDLLPDPIGEIRISLVTATRTCIALALKLMLLSQVSRKNNSFFCMRMALGHDAPKNRVRERCLISSVLAQTLFRSKICLGISSIPPSACSAVLVS